MMSGRANVKTVKKTNISKIFFVLIFCFSQKQKSDIRNIEKVSHLAETSKQILNIAKIIM